MAFQRAFVLFAVAASGMRFMADSELKSEATSEASTDEERPANYKPHNRNNGHPIKQFNLKQKDVEFKKAKMSKIRNKMEKLKSKKPRGFKYLQTGERANQAGSASVLSQVLEGAKSQNRRAIMNRRKRDAKARKREQRKKMAEERKAKKEQTKARDAKNKDLKKRQDKKKALRQANVVFAQLDTVHRVVKSHSPSTKAAASFVQMLSKEERQRQEDIRTEFRKKQLPAQHGKEAGLIQKHEFSHRHKSKAEAEAEEAKAAELRKQAAEKTRSMAEKDTRKRKHHVEVKAQKKKAQDKKRNQAQRQKKVDQRKTKSAQRNRQYARQLKNKHLSLVQLGVTRKLKSRVDSRNDAHSLIQVFEPRPAVYNHKVSEEKRVHKKGNRRQKLHESRRKEKKAREAQLLQEMQKKKASNFLFVQVGSLKRPSKAEKKAALASKKTHVSNKQKKKEEKTKKRRAEKKEAGKKVAKKTTKTPQKPHKKKLMKRKAVVFAQTKALHKKARTVTKAYGKRDTRAKRVRKSPMPTKLAGLLKGQEYRKGLHVPHKYTSHPARGAPNKDARRDFIPPETRQQWAKKGNFGIPTGIANGMSDAQKEQAKHQEVAKKQIADRVLAMKAEREAKVAAEDKRVKDLAARRQQAADEHAKKYGTRKGFNKKQEKLTKAEQWQQEIMGDRKVVERRINKVAKPLSEAEKIMGEGFDLSRLNANPTRTPKRSKQSMDEKRKSLEESFMRPRKRGIYVQTGVYRKKEPKHEKHQKQVLTQRMRIERQRQSDKKFKKSLSQSIPVKKNKHKKAHKKNKHNVFVQTFMQKSRKIASESDMIGMPRKRSRHTPKAESFIEKKHQKHVRKIKPFRVEQNKKLMKKNPPVAKKATRKMHRKKRN